MLTKDDIRRCEEHLGEIGELTRTEQSKWATEQLLKADAFNKELLNQIYQLRATLKMVL